MTPKYFEENNESKENNKKLFIIEFDNKEKITLYKKTKFIRWLGL